MPSDNYAAATASTERQMATAVDEVRADHRLRYSYAIEELRRRGRLGHVIDAGCGVGYGASMLADHAERVTAIEISAEAHDIYQKHWSKPNIDFRREDLLGVRFQGRVDAVVCFEFIEHITFYNEAIEKFATWSDLLIISTPNELVRPHKKPPVNPFHVRHFTPDEMKDLLKSHGFQIKTWHCQKSGAEPDVLSGTKGKFIIATATRRPFSLARLARHMINGRA